MGRCFKDEIAYILQAITWATTQEVLSLQRAILNTSSRSLFAIGSGGSYTVATFAATRHEKRFGQMSRAVTPLEYRGAGAAIRDAAALMLSAEGKNKDILAAAQSTLIFEHVGLALTLKSDTPLGKFASSSGAMSIQEFEMPWGTLRMHQESVSWLSNEMARRDSRPVVVVTHTAPHRGTRSMSTTVSRRPSFLT